MSKSSLIPLDFFLDMCPFDLYSKTGPSIPSCNPAIAPDISMIHGMNISTNNHNMTAFLESHANHPMLNGELLLSYCPSTSLNMPSANDTMKLAPSLIPCALTQCCSNNNLQSIINLSKTINEYLDDIIRLLIHMDTSSDRRMHSINNLLQNIQFIVQRLIYIQQKIIKPLNDSSSDMLKLNMLIRSNNNQSNNNNNNNSVCLDHRLHDEVILILKQIVSLIDSSRFSAILTNVNLQQKLDSIHEQTNLMHEHLVTITRKLETNII
ncbi:unnamed protein product [Rotaria magnacalcarata]|uniref:Uncharacterized protein n=1 Tax=Rotaria magnacalcarata TaxID=392030 RepID=A0A815ADA4_9BILA|nr:unnamed protein product [Rotaria magnacalcarata]CAF1486249.1 unnamed protein product [Rotaria magnacalcarata]CAF2052987.1 unnamed protein product [Rotaria magnacalcarata]CAF2151561.1 unnamed protein product [Rotaria magnacalcarata]CAF2175095.1 unnamed protein product [Rotaria magnacalcarata]